jgi:hypothetical protein
MNAINVIAPYKHHGMWVFDDRTSYQSGQVFSPPFGKGCFQFDAEPRGGGFGK